MKLLNLHAAIVLMSLLYFQINCDIHTQCYQCFQNSSYSKYCMLGMEATTGKCCLTGSGEDCLKDQFYCTDKISTSFTFHKYAFCSFNPSNCGSQKRNLYAKQSVQQVYTTLDFRLYDICPYYIVTDTDLPFNTKVKVTVNTVVNSDVYLLVGTSLDSISTQQKISSGESVSFDSDKIGILIIKSTYDPPFVSFSYQNEQIISNAGWIGIIIGCSMFYFIVLMVILIVLTRFLTKRRLRAMQSPNIVYFLKKKVNQYLAGIPDDMPFDRNMPPPPSQRYTPLYDEKKYDQLVIPPPPLDFDNMNQENFMGQTDQMGRIDTAHEIKPLQGGPQFQAQLSPGTDMRGNSRNNGVGATEKPKVQIRPYKFSFD